MPEHLESVGYNICTVYVFPAYLGPKATSLDGHDYCFQVNFLSHFYLTNLLIRQLGSSDQLSSASPIRVINLTSDSYVIGDRNFDDVIGAKYSIYGMYATTKLAMMLFTAELTARYSTLGVKAVAVHPGIQCYALAVLKLFVSGGANRGGSFCLGLTEDFG